MGANNSIAENDPRRNFQNKDLYSTSSKHRLEYHGVSNVKGKPPPPEGTPSIRNIGHNSLTVVWSPPRGQSVDSILSYRVELYNVASKRWKVIINCCQGTSYDVKDLQPDSEYCLRIRAENVYGWSKPSQSTHVVRTRSLPNSRAMFEQEQAKNNKLVRRHSFHIKIEPNVENILHNKTEESSKCNTIGTIPMRRNSHTRMSLPIQRRTTTGLLSGPRRESMRESRRSIEESSVCTDSTDESSKPLKLHRVSMSTDTDSCAQSMSSASMTSIPEINEELDSLDESAKEEFVWKQNWVSPTPEVSQADILRSPYSDDTKIALFSRTPPSQNHSNFLNYISTTMDNQKNDNCPVWKEKDKDHIFSYDINDITNSRPFQNIMCSSGVMTKSQDADTNGNYAFNKLYDNIIKEVDEESVMIDRVSTL